MNLSVPGGGITYKTVFFSVRIVSVRKGLVNGRQLLHFCYLLCKWRYESDIFLRLLSANDREWHHDLNEKWFLMSVNIFIPCLFFAIDITNHLRICLFSDRHWHHLYLGSLLCNILNVSSLESFGQRQALI